MLHISTSTGGPIKQRGRTVVFSAGSAMIQPDRAGDPLSISTCALLLVLVGIQYSDPPAYRFLRHSATSAVVGRGDIDLFAVGSNIVQLSAALYCSLP